MEYYEIHPEKPVPLIFLDVEKAFGKFLKNSLQFLKKQIIIMGFRNNFMNIIEVIYKKDYG